MNDRLTKIVVVFRVIVENAVFEQFGREEFLRMMHNRSSHIIKKAIDEGRVVSNV